MKKLLTFLFCLITATAVAQTVVPDQRPHSGQMVTTNKANVFLKNQFLGTPAISDTGVAWQMTGSVNGYYQTILQNTNAGSAASADYIVNNNSGTATTFYGDFGINSSTFSGTGSLGLPNATYLYSQSGDLVLGTGTANAMHFVINGGATDALTINTSNNLVVPAFNTTGLVTNSSGGVLLTSATLPSGLFPALTGDTTTSAGSTVTTTSKVNGVSYGTSPSTNTVPVVTGANAITYEAVPNAALANSAITVNGQTCTLGSSCLPTSYAAQFGSLGLGTGTLLNNSLLAISKTVTDPASLTTGSYISTAGTLSSGNNANAVIGELATASLDSGANNATGTLGVRGLNVTATGLGSGTITGIAGVESSTTYTGSGTLTNAYNYFGSSPNITSGTLTNFYGYYQINSSATATINAAFGSNMSSGTGKYGLYLSGTAQNYLNGVTTIGTSAQSGSAELTVAGNLAFTPTTAGIVGTATNDNAGAGMVGEVIPSSIPSGSAVSLVSSTAKQVTNISLTAGDWDVCGQVEFTGATTTAVTYAGGQITSSNNTVADAQFGYTINFLNTATVFLTTNPISYTVPCIRVSLASTTTYYLNAVSSFATSTCSAYGGIYARRRR